MSIEHPSREKLISVCKDMESTTQGLKVKFQAAGMRNAARKMGDFKKELMEARKDCQYNRITKDRFHERIGQSYAKYKEPIDKTSDLLKISNSPMYKSVRNFCDNLSDAMSVLNRKASNVTKSLTAALDVYGKKTEKNTGGTAAGADQNQNQEKDDKKPGGTF